MKKADMKRLDYNWERRLRRALNKHGCSLRKKRIATEDYRGVVYTVRDADMYFTSLWKVQTWYESTFC